MLKSTWSDRERQKDIAKKDKEKRKRRLELEKQRQEGRRLRFFENTFRDSMRFQFTKVFPPYFRGKKHEHVTRYTEICPRVNWAVVESLRGPKTQSRL